MILVVESGSTKSDWVLVENGIKIKRFKTMGFNPFFHNETIIYNAIKYNNDLCSISKNVKQVFFYGAGCSSEEMNNIIKKALSRVFINSKINVDHDLLACALATYEDQPSISCILGTGSNSCYYDGENLSETVPAIGYILGDEGSGSFYGKILLTDFLYNRLPDEIKEEFIKKFKINKDIIFENIYMKPHANVYLASFMRFISDFKHTDYVDTMIKAGMKKFMLNHVCCYKNHKEFKVHFIGSISFIFKEQLTFAANETGINVGQIIKNPVDKLVDYHIR
jgi:N-acetylglucosamine kinase-like BadF-type ATPase